MKWGFSSTHPYFGNTVGREQGDEGRKRDGMREGEEKGWRGREEDRLVERKWKRK